MEKKIKAYEKYMAKKDIANMSASDKKALADYHIQMLAAFQQERLVHLLVTLFFAAMSVGFLILTGFIIYNFGLVIEFLPLYFLTLILVVLTGFYVRHYYFLENHVQGLYKYTEQLMA